MTLKELKEKVKDEVDIDVTTTSIFYVLRGMHYSVTRLVTNPLQRKIPRVIDAREIYARKFGSISTNYDCKNIIYVDKTGFNVNMRRIGD